MARGREQHTVPVHRLLRGAGMRGRVRILFALLRRQREVVLMGDLPEGVPVPPLSDEETRRLRVMAEYFAEPVWGRHPDRTPFTVESLPLPDDLKQRLRTWAKRYDALEATDYEWPSAAQRDAFNAAGRELTREVQEALGPDWDVRYEEA